MKQLFLTTAMALSALALMTACSTDDTASETTNTTQDKVAIGFENYVGRANTRGSVTSASDVQSNGFGVFAYYTTSDYTSGTGTYSPNLMDNFQVKGGTVADNDNLWSYDDPRYWPTASSDRVSFLAYAPYASSTSLVASDGTNSGDLTYIAYTASSDVASQNDILYNSNDNLNLYYYGTNTGEYSANLSDTKKVKMKFTHATSRIAFKVTSSTLPDAAGSTTIKVTGITVGSSTTGFYNTAYLNLDPDLGTGESRWAIPTSATTTNNFTYSSLTGELTTNSSTFNVGTTSDGNYLFIIPQDFSTGTALPVEVTFSIKYKEGAEVSGYTASGTLAQNFEAGKAYLITMDLKISGSGDFGSAKPIQFTVTEVEDWGTETDKAVTF